jgi:hypothetical protein
MSDLRFAFTNFVQRRQRATAAIYYCVELFPLWLLLYDFLFALNF